MSAGIPAVWPLKLCALAISLAAGVTGGVFRSGGTPPLSTRAEPIRAIPVSAIAMRGSFRPRERSCAASPTDLCCHHLRKSSTSRVRGCNCGGDLTSSDLVDSLPMRPRSRVFGARHDRAGWGRRDGDSVVRGKLDGASFRPVLCTPSRKRRSNSPGLNCGAGPNPETPIRSSLNANDELASSRRHDR